MLPRNGVCKKEIKVQERSIYWWVLTKKACKYYICNVHAEVKPQRIQSSLWKALPKLAYTATAGQFRVLIMTIFIYFPWSQKLRNSESIWRVCLTFSLSRRYDYSAPKSGILSGNSPAKPSSFNPQPNPKKRPTRTELHSIPLEAPQRRRRGLFSTGMMSSAIPLWTRQQEILRPS